MNRIFNYIFKVKQERLNNYLFKFLELNYGSDNVYTGKKFLIARGDIPVVLIAHLDTVQYQGEDKILYYTYAHNRTTVWSPKGLGADDRAGVYSIMQIIKRGYRPHIIFTHDEETGAGGAKEVTNYKLPFEYNFFIELDRQGTKEAVFYSCGNKEFQEKILSYGFKLNYGTFSDISVLSPVYDVASVNLGIGYYNEHTVRETLEIEQMQDTIEKVIKILDDEKIAPKKYDYSKVAYTINNYYASTGYNNYSDYNDDYKYDTYGTYSVYNPNATYFMSNPNYEYINGKWIYVYKSSVTKNKEEEEEWTEDDLEKYYQKISKEKIEDKAITEEEKSAKELADFNRYF